jgi:putative ABC transport system permease protein
MSLFKIAWRSIEQRRLSSFLTALSMALGVTLVISVLVIHKVIKEYFSESTGGYHLIVGAKGGKLQLVLNTIYHLSQPINNVPYSFYKEFTEGQFAANVEVAIPICLGDNYRGFRIVGTTPEMFTALPYGTDDQGNDKRYEFAAGESFKQENFFDCVVGSVAAAETGLKVGDKLEATHGLGAALEENATVHTDHPFVVAGILQPTGTPNDRAVFVNMEGFLLIPEHLPEGVDPDALPKDEHGHLLPVADEHREVTAILVKASGLGGLEAFSDQAAAEIAKAINDGNVAQAISPVREVRGLFNVFVAPVQYVLLGLSALVVLVAGIGVMVSIYNSMSDRRREIAVMRALGAGRSTVMSIVLLESILLSVAGGIGGILLGHALIGVLNPLIVAQTGVEIEFWRISMEEFIIIPILIVLAALVGYLPAVSAYRTDVGKALSENP